MKTVVIKVSGSLIYPPNSTYINKFLNIIKKLSEKYRIIIVVGGGKLARQYIEALRDNNVNQGLLDMIGIESSRLNARLLAYVLHPLAPIDPPRNVHEFLEALPLYRIIVMGGLQPGQSTNAVSMIAAELSGASIVINLLRNVPGVYPRYPPKEGEEPLSCITLSELWNIVKEYKQEAGRYALIDHIALNIADRSRIRIVFVEGRDPSVIENIVLNGNWRGTLVVHDHSECRKNRF